MNVHGEKRSNTTHRSTTDLEPRRAKKGKGKVAKLCLMGHVLMENRRGMVVDVEATPATGTTKVEAALRLRDVMGGDRRLTVGGDKRDDQHPFLDACRDMNVTPHVAQKRNAAAVDGRTTRHAGDKVSQTIRTWVEEISGWGKTVGCCRKRRFRGVRLVNLERATGTAA